MGEISVLLAQSGLRREKLLARALAQKQSISADEQVHLKGATINLPNENEAEPMTPPTKRGWTQFLRTIQPWVLLTRCPNITPVTMGCSSASPTQVIRRMNEYQSHPPLSYQRWKMK